MIYTHGLNRGGRGVRSPADGLVRDPDEREAETPYHAENRVIGEQLTVTIELAAIA